VEEAGGQCEEVVMEFPVGCRFTALGSSWVLALPEVEVV
jgi:hypothetical protein